MNCKFPKQKSSQNFGPSNFKSIAGDEPYRWSPTRLELAEGSGNATLRHRGGNWKRTGGCLCLTRSTTMPSSKNWRILFVLGLGPVWLLALWGLGIHLIEATKQKRISEPARKCMPFNIDTTIITMITAPHDEGIEGVSKVDPFLHQDESFQDLAWFNF